MGSIVNTMPGCRRSPWPRWPTCGTSGAPWYTRPMPWPPYSRTMLKRSRCATVWIAWPTSPSVAPGRTCAMPASSASSVLSTSRRASALGVPTQNMRLVSPNQPPCCTATSMLTMSPGRSTVRDDGMPWQTTWLTEVHTVFG